jgi:hypothetical protein
MRLFDMSVGVSSRGKRSQRSVQNAFAFVLGALFFCTSICPANSQNGANRVEFQTLSTSALANAVDLGPVPASQRISVTLTLAPTPARAAALDQFLADLVDGSSKSYRKWVTPSEFAARFGATSDQISAATRWAQAQGLSVDSVATSGTRMLVSGFAGQIQATFSVSLHQYRLGANTFYSNTQEPSLLGSTASLFGAIEGLDNLPTNTVSALAGPMASPATRINGTLSALTVSAISALVEQNSTPILTLDAAAGFGTVSPSQLAGYTALFRQAAAQGITVLLSRAPSSGGFPSYLPEITAVARPDDTPDTEVSTVARPAWQTAPGLPEDSLRHAPDLTATSVTALAATLSTIAKSIPGNRLGNINPVLYSLGPTPELYAQADSVPAGTWESRSGLGLVNLTKLAQVYPKGVGGSYTSFSSTNYAPAHGQSITLSSTVTSGTGGPTPTGTVSFATSSGTVLSTVALDVNGNASYSTNQLAGGSYSLQANYSGDTTYAPSSSPTGTVVVQPEASALTVNVSSGNVYGGTYTVAVSDTASSGVGQPSGNVTLTIQGPGTTYTQALTPSGTNSAVASFSVPATTVGTLTLSVNCTASASFSCYNPYTTTVTVAKATPKLALSYTPNPPVSGSSISLTGMVTGVAGAATPTGNVVFYDNSTTLNSGALTNGTTTITGTVPTTSTHNITATYGGDPNYNSANASGATTASTGVLTATPSATSAAPGSTITISTTVTIAGATSAPSGAVLATVILPPGGTSNTAGTLVATSTTSSAATISLTVPAAGTYQVQVGCPNTDSFTCNTVSFTLTSTNSTLVPTTTLVTSSSYSVAYGTPFTLSAGVKSASSSNMTSPTGTVSFSATGLGSVGSATLSSGLANLLISTAPPAGSYTFTGTYSGDATFAGSTATSSTVTITPVTSTITASVNPSTVGTGASTTVSATVTLPGSSVPPTGNVTVTVPGVSGAIYTGTLVSTGTNAASVNIAVPAPPSGTYQLVVQCTGTTNYTCSPTTVSLTSTAAAKTSTTTAVTASSYALMSGQSITLTATVTPSSVVGGAQPSGTVTFVAAQGVIGTATMSGGVASFTTIAATGTYTITANYSGDATYASSAGTAPNAVVVTPATTSTTASLAATLSATSAAPGSTVDVIATVTLPGSTPPTGIVLATVVLGGGTSNVSGTLTSSGTNISTVTIPITVPAAGTYPIEVGCPATDSFTCNTVTFSLTSVASGKIATTTSLTISPTSPLAGQVVTLTATVTPASVGALPISGSVIFYSGTTQIGTGTVSGGVAVATFTPTGTAAETLTAVYSGDTLYAASTSIPVVITPALTPVSIVLSAVPTTGIAGTSINFTVQVDGVVASGASPTGTVKFYLSGNSPVLLGSATLSSVGIGASVANFVASNVPSGSQSVYAVYSGDSIFAVGQSSVVMLGLYDYSLSFTPASITLTPGESGTVVIQLSTTSGFTGSIALNCTPPPDALITCSLSQTTMTGSGSNTLSIFTTAAPKLKAQNATPLRLLGGVSLAALFCLILPGRKRRRLPSLLLVLFAISLTTGVGCSTSTLSSSTSTSGGTPLGTVNLTVNTSSTNGTISVAHDYSYQITIQ